MVDGARRTQLVTVVSPAVRIIQLAEAVNYRQQTRIPSKTFLYVRDGVKRLYQRRQAKSSCDPAYECVYVYKQLRDHINKRIDYK